MRSKYRSVHCWLEFREYRSGARCRMACRFSWHCGARWLARLRARTIVEASMSQCSCRNGNRSFYSEERLSIIRSFEARLDDTAGISNLIRTGCYDISNSKSVGLS